MSKLDPKEVPIKIERITISRMDNGYCVEADTKIAGKVSHYCSNLKGVTKSLWFMFEGKIRLSREQAGNIKEVLAAQGEKIESRGDNVEEGDDA